jgi:hypothetical protein
MKSHFIKNSIEENITVHNKIIYLQKELNLASSKILNTLIKNFFYMWKWRFNFRRTAFSC